MALSNALISFDLADMLGDDFDARRTKVWLTTNVEDDTIVDTVGNQIRLGSGTVTLNDDGTGSLSTWVPGAGSNPASWQVYVNADYPDPATRTRRQRFFGPFTVTGNANLADLIPEQEVPAEYLTLVTAQLGAYVDDAEEAATDAVRARNEAEALVTSDLGTTDGQTRALVQDTNSQTRGALDATINGAIAASAGLAVDRVINATVSGGTYTADLTSGEKFNLTLTGNATLALSGLLPGRSFVVRPKQDSVGGRMLTLPAANQAVTLGTAPSTFETLVYDYDAETGLVVHKAPGGPFAIPAPPPLNPGALGASVWQDAIALSSSLANGASVSSWADLSGNARHVVQATASKQPVMRYATPADEMQVVTITGAPTGGSFTLTFAGQTTTAIAYNASAATVQAALEALSNIGVGEAVVTGNAGGPYTVVFRLTLGGTNQPQMTATPSLTGGTSPAVTVTTPCQGGTKPGVEFDPTGTPDVLKVPVAWTPPVLDGGLMVGMVFTMLDHGTTTTQTLYAGTASSSTVPQQAGRNFTGANSGKLTLFSSSTLSTGIPIILGVRNRLVVQWITGGTVKTYLNGVLVHTGTTGTDPTGSHWVIGNNNAETNGLKGWLHEGFMVPALVSDANRNSNESYLTGRW